MAQLVKNPPAMQETWVRSLGLENPPEKGKYSTPVFWPRDSTDCIDHGVAESDMTEQLLLSLSLVHPILKIINILKAQSPLFYIKETK